MSEKGAPHTVWQTYPPTPVVRQPQYHMHRAKLERRWIKALPGYVYSCRLVFCSSHASGNRATLFVVPFRRYDFIGQLFFWLKKMHDPEIFLIQTMQNTNHLKIIRAVLAKCVQLQQISKAFEI